MALYKSIVIIIIIIIMLWTA